MLKHTRDVLLPAYWALNLIVKQSVPSATLIPLLYTWAYFVTLVTFVSHRVHSWSRPLKISFLWKSLLQLLVLWNLAGREGSFMFITNWFLHIPWSKCAVSSPIEFYLQVVESKPRVVAIDGILFKRSAGHYWPTSNGQVSQALGFLFSNLWLLEEALFFM